MTTIPAIKELAGRLKNEIKDLTEFEDLYDEFRARKDPNGALSELMEILRCIM